MGSTVCKEDPSFPLACLFSYHHILPCGSRMWTFARRVFSVSSHLQQPRCIIQVIRLKDAVATAQKAAVVRDRIRAQGRPRSWRLPAEILSTLLGGKTRGVTRQQCPEPDRVGDGRYSARSTASSRSLSPRTYAVFPRDHRSALSQCVCVCVSRLLPFRGSCRFRDPA